MCYVVLALPTWLFTSLLFSINITSSGPLGTIFAGHLQQTLLGQLGNVNSVVELKYYMIFFFALVIYAEESASWVHRGTPLGGTMVDLATILTWHSLLPSTPSRFCGINLTPT